MALDRELLKRILEHYKHRVSEFLQDERIKPLASGHLAKPIIDIGKDADAALSTLASLPIEIDTETTNWIRNHASVLRPAVAQYEKDARLLLEEAREKLSGPNLRELEIDLAKIAAELATLLGL